ncbi:MAG: glycogen-binding domain-containing protein [Gemmatimonadota bacterium]|nr:glycogen-binding domain-containing protein [Gemmatimonadota bacterium]MDH3422391.1 glycogen-binding domain-containing protein [Gemmatimonadota bacterium]
MRFGPGPTFVLLLIGAAATYPAAGWGQSPHLELDLAASRIEYDTAAALNAPSVSLLSEWQRPSLFGRVTGSVTGFEGAGWSMQGRASLAGWLSPRGVRSPLRLELGGTGAASRHSRGFDARSGGLDGRVHLVGRRGGGWVGASVAAANTSFDSASVGAFAPSVGAWLQNASVRGMFSYLHTVVAGETYPEANVSLTVSRGPVDLALYGGVREWPSDVGALDERWGGATAAFWVTPKAALVVAGGKYSSDILQGLPGGQFISVGVRLTPRRYRPIPLSAIAPIVYTVDEARPGSIGFDVSGATRVEIAGDWNGWQRLELSGDGSGRWVLPVGLEPGAYRFNLLVDGERWMVPEGIPTIDDGFGDVVGLLIVSGAN